MALERDSFDTEGQKKKEREKGEVTFPLFLFANILPNAYLCASKGVRVSPMV